MRYSFKRKEYPYEVSLPLGLVRINRRNGLQLIEHSISVSFACYFRAIAMILQKGFDTSAHRPQLENMTHRSELTARNRFIAVLSL